MEGSEKLDPTQRDGRRNDARKEKVSSLLNLTVAIMTVLGVTFSIFIYFHDKKNKDIHVVALDSTRFFPESS
jgi:hypothetical protein